MLLQLLLTSRQRLRQFSLSDAEIARRSGADVQDAAAVARTRAVWYQELVRWAVRVRDSGDYALCCSADMVQRKPYDLLAALPLQQEETEMAGEDVLPDTLLRGLSEAEKICARRLYHRLLCIQPMRLLLERLLSLEALLDDPAEMERATAGAKFRQPIPETMERVSGQRLDLRDNDFTILDRLMDNWDRRLLALPEFVLPVSVVESAPNEQTLLTAAVVFNSRGCVTEGGYAPYRAVPGGHVALGVYGEGAPERFFSAVSANQKKGPKRVLRVRSYAGTQLVQLSDEAYDAFRAAEFRRSAVNAPVEKRPDVFCALDDGGRRLIRALREEMRIRRELQAGAWLENLLRGESLSPAHRDKALEMLEGCVRDFFAQEKLPCRISEYTGPVLKKSRHLGVRAVRLLLACMMPEDDLVRMACPDGQPPEEVCRFVAGMRADGDALESFLGILRGMAGKSVRLDMRYENMNPRMLTVLRTTEADLDWLGAYLAGAALYLRGGAKGFASPAFDAAQLKAACLQGLRHFAFFGKGVGTGNATFTLDGLTAAALADGQSKEANRKPEDALFQLFCLWCMHVCHGGRSLCFSVNKRNFGETLFEMGNAGGRFVDLIAGSEQEAAGAEQRFTPAALHSFLPKTAGMTLMIRKQAPGRFEISSPA